MLALNEIEKALLIGVVKDHSWETLIKNGINESYFSAENKPLYRYIKDAIAKDLYPDLPLLQFEFKIDDEDLMAYAEVGELDNLCTTIRHERFKQKLYADFQDMAEDLNGGILDRDAKGFLDKFSQINKEIRVLGNESKSVGLLDNIEETLRLDPNDVISTGFKELDEKLIGWKRGEELVVLVGRTGQGKSWLRIKICFRCSIAWRKSWYILRRNE